MRLVVEPKPDLPTDPNDPRAFIDVFTDIEGLFVINNESGWYEGWMIHDLGSRRWGRRATTTRSTRSSARCCKPMPTRSRRWAPATTGHGQFFTTDGNAVRFPSEDDHFPDVQTNLVPIQLSMGAYNALQQSDAHSYWEFNYTTNWIHPLYELPFTGGIPGTFEAGQIGGAAVDRARVRTRRIAERPGGLRRQPVPAARSRQVRRRRRRAARVPHALHPQRPRQRDLPRHLRAARVVRAGDRVPAAPFDAYEAEVAHVDQDGDGVISAVEGDIDSASDGFADNARLFLPATSFDRFAVTREINDGLLAPRFAPSQKAWVLTGAATPVAPSVPASANRDSDDR